MYKLAILLAVCMAVNANDLHWQVYVEVMLSGRRVANGVGKAKTHGTQVELFDKSGGEQQQSFCITSDDHDASHFWLRLCYQRDSCLTNQGGYVKFGACNDAAKLTYNPHTHQVKDSTGKCMDSRGRYSTNHTELIWYNCNGGDNQSWNFSKVYKGAGLYWSVPWVLQSSARQHKPVVAGEFYLQTQLTNKYVIDCKNRNISAGTTLHLWSKWGGANQRWCMETMGGNKMKFYYCAKPNLCAINDGRDWFTLGNCTDSTYVTVDATKNHIMDPHGKCLATNHGRYGKGTYITWETCGTATRQQFKMLRSAEYVDITNLLADRYAALVEARRVAAEKARLAKLYADKKRRHAALRTSTFATFNNASSCGTIATNGRCGSAGAHGTRCSWGYCSQWSWCGSGTDYVRSGQTQYNHISGCRTAAAIAKLKSDWDHANPSP